MVATDLSASHPFIAPYANILHSIRLHIARLVNLVHILAVPNHAGGWNPARSHILFMMMRCEILSGTVVIVSHTHSDHWSWPAIANFCIFKWSMSQINLCDCFSIVRSAWSQDISLVPNQNWSGAMTLYHWSTNHGIIFLHNRELVGVPCTSNIGVPSLAPRSI